MAEPKRIWVTTLLNHPLLIAIILAALVLYITEGATEFLLGMSCVYGVYFYIRKANRGINTQEKNEQQDFFRKLSMQEKPLDSHKVTAISPHLCSVCKINTSLPGAICADCAKNPKPPFNPTGVIFPLLLFWIGVSVLINKELILLPVCIWLIALVIPSPTRWFLKRHKPNSYFWLATTTLVLLAALYSRYTILGIVPLIITAIVLLPQIRLVICQKFKMQENAAILLSLAISLPAPALIINAVTAFELNEKNTAIQNEKIAQEAMQAKQQANEKLRQERMLAKEQKAKEDEEKQQRELKEFINNPTPTIQEITSLISKKDYKTAQQLYEKLSPSNNKELIALKEPIYSAYAFTEDDFYWHDNLKPYKKIIIKGVNKIHKEDARCKSISPATTYISRDKSSLDNPVFFVTCGKFPDAVNVFFSRKDIEEGMKFEAPVHIDKAIAVEKCAAHAKSEAAHPSTVNFSHFMNLAVTEHKNGNTTVFSTFTAKNSYNLEIKFNIKCLLNADGLIEANINESN